MQTIWKGAISFGLVTIPVRLFAATEEHGVSFHQVHAADGGRIRYRRVCEIDGDEVAFRDIAKGYELPDGSTVVITKDDLDALPLKTNREIDVMRFVPSEQIDSVYYARSYYLQPDGPGAKPYRLLTEALERSGRIALVKVALRNRESLATLRPRDGVLVLQTMLWPDEVRDAGSLAPDAGIEVRPQEVAMAESLIDSLTGDFEPDEFTDEYRAAVEALVAEKAGGEQVTRARPAGAEPGAVVDLMAALQASVEAARQARGEQPAKPTTGRRTARAATGARGASGAKKPAREPAAKAPARKAAGGSERKATGKTPTRKTA